MAVQEGNSDVVEVRLAGGAGVLQVLLNQEVLSFTEQSWMDLKGEWRPACHRAALAPSLPAWASERGCRGGSLSIRSARCPWHCAASQPPSPAPCTVDTRPQPADVCGRTRCAAPGRKVRPGDGDLV